MDRPLRRTRIHGATDHRWVGAEVRALVLGVVCAATATAGDASTLPVTVTVDRPVVSVGADVGITIVNNGEASVRLTDQQALCSVVALERFTDGAWRPWTPCLSTVPSREIALPPGASYRVALPTAGATSHVAIGPGRYRIAVQFTIEKDGTRSELTAVSDTIDVQ